MDERAATRTNVYQRVPETPEVPGVSILYGRAVASFVDDPSWEVAWSCDCAWCLAFAAVAEARA